MGKNIHFSQFYLSQAVYQTPELLKKWYMLGKLQNLAFLVGIKWL